MTGYDVVVIGDGPAGCSAGFYGAREGLRTLLIERRELPVLPSAISAFKFLKEGW